jgi:hypothetical protein
MMIAAADIAITAPTTPPATAPTLEEPLGEDEEDEVAVGELAEAVGEWLEAMGEWLEAVDELGWPG